MVFRCGAEPRRADDSGAVEEAKAGPALGPAPGLGQFNGGNARMVGTGKGNAALIARGQGGEIHPGVC